MRCGPPLQLAALRRAPLWGALALLHACDGAATAPAGPRGLHGADGGAGDAAHDSFHAHASVARRLSRAELDNTLRDLFGDDSAPAEKLLAEDEFAPYDNDSALQNASQALIDALEALAVDVAARVVASPAMRARVVPCTPSGAGDVACFRQVVEQLGRRAFRRPLSAEEVAPYLALQSFATEDNPDVDNGFDTAVELLIRAIVQDPEFLYRIEVGAPTGDPGVFALDDYEIAARLSYLLWGSTPDDALLDAALAGELKDAEGRHLAAERLLTDERARRQLHRFHAMWLGYRAIPHPAELSERFAMETGALIDRVVFDEDRNYLDLFRLEETYVDAELAAHYGLPAPDGERGWVGYGDSGRAGILSHGSVLAAFSKFSDTSPTQRGIFVKTRLLCEPVGRPPAEVDVDQPPSSESSPCKFERYSAHRQLASCASCHDQIDGIGFGLENFDIAGRYRTHDDGLPECSITGAGELAGVGSFSGPGELGTLLVEEGRLDDCTVKQYLTFALGRALGSPDMPRLDALIQTFAQNDHSLRALLLDIVTHDAFALRKEESP